MTPDVLLVAGNGLAIDLRQTFTQELAAWNSSQPLDWEVSLPPSNTPLRDGLSLAASAIDQARAVLPPGSADFDIINHITTHDNFRAVLELRHYLALAYSSYQFATERFAGSNRWSWGRFLRQHKPRLQGVVSLNYDLILEYALRKGSRHLYHTAVRAGLGVNFFKPHGSINYEPHDIVHNLSGYPLRVYMDMNDIPVRLLDKQELSFPRKQVDLVLPAEAGRYGSLTWNRAGWEWLHGLECNTMIIAGISYWEVDRPELDRVFSSVPQSAQVIVANPYPSDGMMETLGRRFTHISHWANGPETL